MTLGNLGLLLIVFFTRGQVAKTLGDAWPLIVGAFSAVPALIDPLTASRYYGSMAKPTGIPVLMFVYVFFLGVWIYHAFWRSTERSSL